MVKMTVWREEIKKERGKDSYGYDEGGKRRKWIWMKRKEKKSRKKEKTYMADIIMEGERNQKQKRKRGKVSHGWYDNGKIRK